MKRALLVAVVLALLLPFAAAGGQELGQAQGVIYEVFVRAFADSDGDGIGDLKGLTGKLDYIKGLGVGGIWLMPIFPSPSYHGYDVTDYRNVNPEYGSLEDYQALLDAAHERGLFVLLDLPLNHTSSRHPWFVQSQQEGSPMREWYHWAKEGDPGLDTTLSVWGQKPWKPLGGAYYYALFWEGMPDLNFHNEQVRREAIDIAAFWLNLGTDGFRLDAASHIFATGETKKEQDLAASQAFWTAFSRELKQRFPNSRFLGEAWEPLALRAQILPGLDQLVNFDVGDRLIPLIKSGGSGKAFVSALQTVYTAYEKAKPGFVDAPFLSNHDQNRVFSALGSQEQKAKLAASVLLTLPGTPIVYYGEEIGMAGAKPDEELRTPMLWGEGEAGMTTWRASRYNARTKSVLKQEGEPASLLLHYRKMIALRNSLPALSTGRLTPYEADNPLPIAFFMQGGGQTLLVLHNPSRETQLLSVTGAGRPVYADADCAHADGTASLAPYSSMIILMEEPTP